MGSVSTISIKPSELNLFDRTKIEPEAALKASEILQENHHIHHVLFNSIGLHNHIVHQITTDLALGATPEILEQHYLKNKSYQRGPGEKEDVIVRNLKDPEIFRKFRGDNSHYAEYVDFFRQEINKNGYEAVLNRYLFEGDEIANDMLQRFVTFHPLIHVTCGIEFNQPALVVEGLALTITSANRVGDYFDQAEKIAASIGQPSSKSLLELIQAVAFDEKVQAVTHYGKAIQLFNDGPVQNAPEEMARYASQWNVGSSTVPEKAAELINAAAFVTGAAQRPPKSVKFDFIGLHSLTTCHYLLVLLSQSWISDENKVRLVEYTGRMELGAYAIGGSPKLDLNEINKYLPKKGSLEDGWDPLVKRALGVQDDGHTAKVIRSLMHGQQFCGEFEGKANFMIEGDVWQQIGHMCLDSVEDADPRWIWLAGYAESWEKVPDRTS